MSEVRKFTLVAGDARSINDLISEMDDRIREVVYSYAEKVPVAVAIGVLHIAAKEILDEQA
jgi:hypothetical protein